MIYSQGRKPAGKQKRLSVRLIVIGLVVAVLAGGTVFVLDALDIAPLGIRRGDNELLRLWNESDYDEVLRAAHAILDDRPLDGEALTFGGFAEFYTGIEFVDQSVRRERLERSITLLRKALHVPRAPLAAERDYVLAKAYYHSGEEYVDLAIRYMERSIEGGYEASDSRTYLGLGYARLGRYDDSVDWLERAIEGASREDVDALRIKAAESYVAVGDYESAIRTLRAAIESLDDDFLILMARNELASVLILDEQFDAAENLLGDTIEEFDESADAYYYLGMVHDETERGVQARALWRTAIAIDPNHTGALQRLANWGN